MTKAMDTHSEYVTLFAFLLQQWLRERVCLIVYEETWWVDLKETLVVPSFQV